VLWQLLDASIYDAGLTGALEDARQLCIYDNTAIVYYNGSTTTSFATSTRTFSSTSTPPMGLGKIVAKQQRHEERR
jgi:hypothetical protein